MPLKTTVYLSIYLSIYLAILAVSFVPLFRNDAAVKGYTRRKF